MILLAMKTLVDVMRLPLTLKITTAQVVETWSSHCQQQYSGTGQDNHSPPSYEMTPEFLRANVCNFRESADSREFCNFFIFCPNNLYSTLISKITSKLVTAFYFFMNLASPQTSIGVRLSRIHFSPTDVC